MSWRKLLSPQTNSDPLAEALRRKAETGAPGDTEGTTVAAGAGWRVRDVLCTSGPCDRPFEERQSWTSISLVVCGVFEYRTHRGACVMSPNGLVLGNAGETFECAHRHGEGDRCLSFQFDADLFERLAHDAGASRPAFDHPALPPLRALAPITARARTALARGDSLEEIALDLGGAATAASTPGRRTAPAVRARDADRVARVLRELESRTGEAHTVAELARSAGLSRYHFLRTFKRVTGVTPHQWVLRARLRHAAERLVTTCDPVTDIALEIGFQDLSNFIRSFRAEFGVSPRAYRADPG